MKRWLLRLGILMLVLTFTPVLYVIWVWFQAAPDVAGQLQVHGLHSPVEVTRDSIGVPHIFAANFDDAILAQGYITAQDRLWQMDLLRRLGNGELSEVFGNRTLDEDREQRILGVRRTVLQQERNLPATDLQCLRRYAEGVNAYLSSHRDRLPIEFHILRYQPSDWSPKDTLAICFWMGKLLSNSWKTDLMRERLYSKLDRKLVDRLLPEFSPNDVLMVGGDKAPSLTPKPTWEREPRTTTSLLRPAAPCSSEAASEGLLFNLRQSEPVPSGVGSNNWVVGGSRTASGKPILANDPHLPLTVPSIWYMTHLQVPADLDVIGVTIPGAPGIILGHNQEIAWGATNLMADVQDLYIEEIHPQDGRLYRVGGSWQRIDEYQETIQVKGGNPEIATVRVTRHGPIVSNLGGRVLALRWSMLDAEATYPFANHLDRARNWGEFQAALKQFVGPPQNFVFADRNGNVGFLDAGRIPVRAKGDGVVPLPGAKSEYEWEHYLPFEQLPRVFNPASGLILSANNRIVGTSFPIFLTHNWASPDRARRIQDVLNTKTGLRVRDMLKIQADVYSDVHRLISKRILEAIKSEQMAGMPEANPRRFEALASYLQSYDFNASVDSVGASICEEFRKTYLEMVLKGILGEEWKIYRWMNENTLLEDILRTQPRELLPNDHPDYESLARDCLLQSLNRLELRFGSVNPQDWRWGKYCPIEFKHPLGEFWPLSQLFNTGPYPQPGTPLTVKQTTPVVGVSMRMVVDLDDFDKSVNNITLGQSGQVLNSHYRDQFMPGLNAETFPMLFTNTEIRRQAASTLWLNP